MKAHTVLGAVFVTAVALAPAGARAHHVLVAEHARPAAALDGHAVTVDVPVATTCPIAYCGWLEADVTYWLSDGVRRTVSDTMTYQPAVVFRLTIPAEHVRAHSSYEPLAWLTYRIQVRQWDCRGDCHQSVVDLPRTGGEYGVPIIDTGA